MTLRLLFSILAMHHCVGANAFEATRASPSELFESGVMIEHYPGDPALGPPDAEIVIFEFIDYACPYCRKLAPAVLRLAEDNPDIRIVFKEFPFLGYPSEHAARASIAAFRQGNWSTFHGALMGSEVGLTIDEAIAKAAEAAHLDRRRLLRDMNAAETDAIIARNREMAQELRIHGTPSIIFGDTLVTAAVDLKTMMAYVSAQRFLLSDETSPELHSMLLIAERLSNFRIGSAFSTPVHPFKDTARQLAEKAVRHYPSRSDVYVALAKLYDGETAITHLDKAIELDPDNSNAYFHRALRRQADSAISDFEKAAQLEPDCFDCYIELAKSWGDRGNLSKKASNAIKAFEIVDRLRGEKLCESQTWRYLSFGAEVRQWMNFFNDRKMYETEGDVLRSTISLGVDFLSQCFAKVEHLDEDIKEDVWEDYGCTLSGLYIASAWRWRDQGKNDRFWSDIMSAKSWCVRRICGADSRLWYLLDSDPSLAKQFLKRVDEGHCWRTAGRYYSKLQDEEGFGTDGFPVSMDEEYWYGVERDVGLALANLDLAIKRDASDWSAFVLRARLLADIGEYERSIDDYDRALELDASAVVDSLSSIWLRRCYALANIGRFEEAVNDCERGSTGDGSGNPEIIIAQIFLMEPNPRFDARQALGWAQRAVDKNSSANHRLIFAHALSVNGDVSAALQEYEGAISGDPAVLGNLRTKLRKLGYTDKVGSGEYDVETQAALEQCVQRGCRLWED